MISEVPKNDDDRTPDDGVGGTAPGNGDADTRESVRTQKLVSRAVTENWTGAGRWDTDATPEQLSALQAERELTAKERALLAILADLSSRDSRPRQIAVRNLIQMEQQNMADEHKAQPDLHHHQHEAVVIRLPAKQSSPRLDGPNGD